MIISIGSDHAGFDYKEKIIKLLKNNGFTTIDRGPHTNLSVDYPDYSHPVAKDVEEKNCDFGILICGSGNGVCMTANKHKGVRAALCWSKEIASLARLHNDANILCIPARFVSQRMANSIVNVFLATPFEGGRHLNRVHKISC
jgi:ribose 5-phosphate isomerase B